MRLTVCGRKASAQRVSISGVQDLSLSETERRRVMRILLAVDGSKFSEAATQTVIVQVQAKGTECAYACHRTYYQSAPRNDGLLPRELKHARDARRKLAETLVAKTAEFIACKNLNVTTVVSWAARNLKYDTAAEWHADLIVLGSHGRRA